MVIDRKIIVVDPGGVEGCPTHSHLAFFLSHHFYQRHLYVCPPHENPGSTLEPCMVLTTTAYIYTERESYKSLLYSLCWTKIFHTNFYLYHNVTKHISLISYLEYWLLDLWSFMSFFLIFKCRFCDEILGCNLHCIIPLKTHIHLLVFDNKQNIKFYVPLRHSFNSLNRHLVWCVVYLAYIVIHWYA